MRSLRIDRVGVEAVRRHAAASRPEECCGILLGAAIDEAVVVREVMAAANVSRGDRRHRYSIAPRDLLAAARRARAAGLEVVGYYHSHPAGGARPSERDLRHAWPGVSYLIVGLASGAEELRSWRLAAVGVGFVEEPLEVDGDEVGS